MIIGTQTAAAAAVTSMLYAAPAPPGGEVIHLGDLNPPVTAPSQGASFDPCSPTMWDGVPAQVRPEKPKTPRNVPSKSESSEPFVMCVLEHSGGRTNGILSVYIAWGALSELDGNDVDFGGVPGKVKGSQDKQGRPQCATRVYLPGDPGAAGVSVVNSKFPEVDVCDIATSVSKHIAEVAR